MLKSVFITWIYKNTYRKCSIFQHELVYRFVKENNQIFDMGIETQNMGH